jgi:predicted kinase
MMKGLPASGKSTIAKTYVDGFNMVRVNKDDLRAMLHNSKWSKANEKQVLKIRDQIIRDALANGKSVVVDDTNFAPEHEATLKEIAINHKANFQVEFVDTPLDECIKRDLNRLRSVGEKVIRRMYNQYLRVIETPKPAEKDCVVFDIDGTLAHMDGRSPYDETLVGTDSVDEEVLSLNMALAVARKAVGHDLKIFIMSGRHESCRGETEKWLNEHSIQYDALYMRPTDDDRNDSIVKGEMYEEHINGQYRVWAWFDDRDRVVLAMRNKGIKVLQVAEGDF